MSPSERAARYAILSINNPVGPAGVEEAVTDHAKRAAELRAQATEEDAKQAAKEAKDALLKRIENDAKLAGATTLALDSLRNLINGKSVHVAAMESFATFRKELAPLAESYGYKFVLVGNKSKAALTVL